MSKASITVIDDDESICELFSEALQEEYDIETYQNGEDGMEALREREPDVLILDLRLPGMGGLEILRKIEEDMPNLHVIMVTAHKDVDSAVEAMKRGAYDYIIKPFDLEEIKVLIEKCLENKELKEEVEDLKSHLGEDSSDTSLIGSSDAMEEVRERIEKVLAPDSSVLIRGESGAGKEVVAKMIHQQGPRSSEPFIAVNCASVPDNLLESELFGYEKGAFTGADTDRKGKIAMADGGTLFLDEIGAMPYDMQAKLLRVLQEKQIIPIGSEEKQDIDFRLISATSADLENMVKEEGFREDLFFRINVISIDIPPLRERKEDIPELCEHFLRQINKKLDRNIEGIDEEAMDLLMDHEWPGNVRELQNALESAAVVGESPMLKPDDFNLFDQGERDDSVDGEILEEGMSLDDAEEVLIKKTLKENDGNITQSAEKLGITRKTLRNKKEKYGIEI